MKILIHSDTHLGYLETNPILAPDSFVTFAEILLQANNHKVDLILNGGDLFNINNPSRFTLNQTFKILKQFILTTSDKQINTKFNTNVPLVFKDMKINIKIPFLAINGNHDDPAGLHKVSPMSLLHSSGMVHYFGQIESIDFMEVKPIIFKDYNIAIYGIGYMRDDKFLKNLISGKIIFQELSDSNFNILMIHQNRIPIGRVAINENLFDDKFDVIIYGHEHEPQNFRNNKGQLVIQCGSSVRTSLTQMEMSNKYYYILNIPEMECSTQEMKDNFTLEVYELETVRKFAMSTLDLRKEETPEVVIDKLNQEFEKLIGKKYKYNTALFDELNSLINYKKEFKVTEEFLPLIRVRVTTTMPIPRTKFSHHEIFCANKNIIKCTRQNEKHAPKVNSNDIKKYYSKFGNEFYDKMFEYIKSKDLKVIPAQQFIGDLENNKLESLYEKTISEYLKADVYNLDSISNTRNQLNNEYEVFNELNCVDKEGNKDDVQNTEESNKKDRKREAEEIISFDDLFLTDLDDSLLDF